MKGAYQTSPMLAMQRIAVHQHLTEQARAFLADPWRQLEFREQATPAILLQVLKKEGIVAFNRAVRNAISKLNQGVESQPYFDIVDAIGFWEDTTPGRWPYMTLERAEHMLSWAGSFRAGQPFLATENAAA